jgi:hypothetical protein
MRTFYFVGGPTPGHGEAFFRRLEAAGGPPPGWRIYPHARGDGKALHIVRAESDDSINALGFVKAGSGSCRQRSRGDQHRRAGPLPVA